MNRALQWLTFCTCFVRLLCFASIQMATFIGKSYNMWQTKTLLILGRQIRNGELRIVNKTTIKWTDKSFSWVAESGKFFFFLQVLDIGKCWRIIINFNKTDVSNIYISLEKRPIDTAVRKYRQLPNIIDCIINLTLNISFTFFFFPPFVLFLSRFPGFLSSFYLSNFYNFSFYWKKSSSLITVFVFYCQFSPLRTCLCFAFYFSAVVRVIL